MQIRRTVDGQWRRVAGLLVAAIVASGCQSTQEVDAAAAMRARQFDVALVATTEAISDGDLDQARTHLDEARDRAVTTQQKTKVSSLEHLIAGAESMMDGDPQAAAVQWSRIDDPALHREVQTKARQVGMSVPSPQPSTKVSKK